MVAEQKIMQFPQKTPYTPENAKEYDLCHLPMGTPDWWKEIRAAAFDRFQKQGLPTPKIERWKYTNIAAKVAQWDGVIGEHQGKTEGAQDYVQPLSKNIDTDWVRELISKAPPEHEKYGDLALWDLNTAYLHKGAVVDIPKNTKLDEPIHMSLAALDDTFTSLRLIIRVQDGAELTLIENHEGQGEYWKNHVTQIVLGKNAKLHHYRLQNDSAEGVYTQTTSIVQGRDSHYDGFTLTLGGDMTRNQLHADINGPGAHCSFNGLNLLNGKQHGDTTILINHNEPNCTSNQFYRTLLDDEARGVFQGKVYVDQKAQKTDGYQLSNTIMLSDKAEMDTKPELEIYADDVRCSHGATTGQLDEEPLFYLRSRGLNEKQARLLLVQAFVGEVIDEIQNEGFQEKVRELTDNWLSDSV